MALDIQRLVNRKTGIIRGLYRVITYNDLPNMVHYTGELCNTFLFSDVDAGEDRYTTGCSLDTNKAILKAFGEAIERYCIAIYRMDEFLKASYNKIKGETINPCNVVNFSENQLNSEFKDEKYDFIKYDENTEFNWIKGFSLTQERNIYVPAQLVYVPYFFNKEKVIRFPITTGAASGKSLSQAIYNGICEVVERDAFMITYLNSLERSRINIKNIESSYIRKLISTFNKYSLEIFCFDITTDLKIPVVLTIIVDRSGLGPSVSLGMKCDLDYISAIIGSIEEAYQSIPYIRELALKRKNNIKDSKKIVQIEDRAIYWCNQDMIKKLNFLLGTKKTKDILSNSVNKETKEKLKTVINILSKKGYERYKGCNSGIMTFTTLKPISLISLVVISTKEIDEKFKYLGGQRLYNVPSKLGYEEKSEKDLNKIPHPFL